MSEVRPDGSELSLDHEVLRPIARIGILDAGAQYVDLIQKACTRLGYPADILPLDTPFETIENAYSAFIISGGPSSSHTDGDPMPDPAIWGTSKGVLGICKGEQAMAVALGGEVQTLPTRQEGTITTHVKTEHPLFNRTKSDVNALFTHGDFVTEVPEGFVVIGEHELADGQRVISAMAKENFAAVQFHPEVFDDTPQGYDIFQGFLTDMCELSPDKEMLETRTETDAVDRQRLIAEKVGDRHVIAFDSGGVDSTVATVLASKVVDPSKLHIYYIDNGYMRDEDDDVIEKLLSAGLNVQAIDATEAFEQATIELDDGTMSPPLIDVIDPKVKRRIIGTKFADLKDEIAASLGFDSSEVMLLQGTNAADRIESGFSLAGGQATAQIKEHHNQVKAIKDMEAAGILIEPLNDLHKDEIRRIGEYLELPEDVVWRQPFPGPGNAIRILGYREGEYDLPAQELKDDVDVFIYRSKHTVWPDAPIRAHLLPMRSVGVGGDARSYVMPAALEGPSAWPTLVSMAQGIYSLPSNFPTSINRVVYALGDKPVGEYSLTPTTLGREERLQLRHADRIVFEEMRRYNLLRRISQFPVILLPLSFGEIGKRSVVLRPISSNTYMTAKAIIPERDVDSLFFYETADRLLTEVPGISQVFLELTNKPPATTEWE
jgi:GMP synthase (glutamine-hydrolysing)